MEIQEGPSSLFYACPKYKMENREPDERACSNRLSLEDYTKMLEHLHKLIIESEANDEKIDLTNYTWKDRKGTEYKVLSQQGNKLKIQVYNKRALA
jgi:ribosomal protein L15